MRRLRQRRQREPAIQPPRHLHRIKRTSFYRQGNFFFFSCLQFYSRESLQLLHSWNGSSLQPAAEKQGNCRPFLVSGGSEDPPERWIALNHSIRVNKLLGFKNRVAMTNRPTHAPNAESNEQIYRFFERFLKP